ncbi:hypothetical protein ZWY2020_040545 [Hordeum vulgare]|nr:hypothetical protein ZWY2020_040545 [Hordeum vulgare]
MFGAPYDFRYAVAPAGRPSSVGTAFFASLKAPGGEGEPVSNGDRPAIIVTCQLRRGTLAHQRARAGHTQALISGNKPRPPFGQTPGALRKEYRSLQSSLPGRRPARRYCVPSRAAAGENQAPELLGRRRGGFLGDIGFGEGVGPYVSRVLPLFKELPVRSEGAGDVRRGRVATPERMVLPG